MLQAGFHIDCITRFQVSLDSEFVAAREGPQVFTPEQRLCFALVEDALHQYGKPELRPELDAWFADPHDAPMSYRFCCQVIGVDPDRMLNKFKHTLDRI